MERMADTTNDGGGDDQIDGNSQPTMQETEPTINSRYIRGHLSMDFDDYQVHQKIQIEKETLRFLQKSKKFKRPPQSIRISGANVIEESEKLKMFSEFETTLLQYQIKKKIERIKKLTDESVDVPYLKLPVADRKKLCRHFKKKLKFYALQDNTKWKDWPKKPDNVQPKTNTSDKKVRNFKKQQAKRNRRTRKDAKKAMESGAVIVLVENEIPPGAIAVLGKGLGFVPTPTCDVSDERLQMRQTVNRILTESKKRCTKELSPDTREEIPSQLRSVSLSH